ncbi:unnamed protein product [Pieris macdunnoughi]|uniref:Uncharacterized protein n=1 Tax=Pieris macdunnoughi TaxID=345717 RepID=A0A821VFM9_9NEOP|nr:unnamed protein product [Pieris macdunnoughi]
MFKAIFQMNSIERVRRYLGLNSLQVPLPTKKARRRRNGKTRHVLVDMDDPITIAKNKLSELKSDSGKKLASPEKASLTPDLTSSPSGD